VGSDMDEWASLLGKPLHHCKSCGFLSTRRDAYTLRNGHLVCKDCDADYGTDPRVTRWIDELSNNGKKRKEGGEGE